MSASCAIEECKRKSIALCNCCNQNICRIHLDEHDDLINSQVNPFVDELNTVAHQLSSINLNDVISNCRQKLGQWRDDSYKTINLFYEERCEDLEQHCHERFDKHREEIDQMKSKTTDLIQEHKATHEDIPLLRATINEIKEDVKQFKEKGVTVDARPLIIIKDLVYVEEWTLNELNISALPSPWRTTQCSDDGIPAMASNNRYLLLDQYPNLYLFDTELTIVKQSPWEYDCIRDMCWSSTLNSFIIITDKDGVFLVNENITSIESIETIEKSEWLSCTCSDSALYLTTNEASSNIYKFNLLSSFRLIKEWNCPQSSEVGEFIENIAYNNGTLALLIETKPKKPLKIELRSSETLDRLWSLPLDITNIGERVIPICLLKCDEWLIIDYDASHLFHVTKDGQLKVKHKYNQVSRNAVLFGSNILAIRTTECINFYRV